MLCVEFCYKFEGECFLFLEIVVVFMEVMVELLCNSVVYVDVEGCEVMCVVYV